VKLSLNNEIFKEIRLQKHDSVINYELFLSETHYGDLHSYTVRNQIINRSLDAV